MFKKLSFHQRKTGMGELHYGRTKRKIQDIFENIFISKQVIELRILYFQERCNKTEHKTKKHASIQRLLHHSSPPNIQTNIPITNIHKMHLIIKQTIAIRKHHNFIPNRQRYRNLVSNSKLQSVQITNELQNDRLWIVLFLQLILPSAVIHRQFIILSYSCEKYSMDSRVVPSWANTQLFDQTHSP